MYARPTIAGETTTFGVSGKLWRDSLIMYDRTTRSLWSQVLGKAVAGPRAGDALVEIPAVTTTWKEWRQAHPDTLVLDKSFDERMVDMRRRASTYAGYHQDADTIGVRGSENRDRRLGPKILVFGVERPGGSAAVPLSLLAKQPVLNTELFGEPVVFFSPPGETAVLGYRRTLGDQELTFERVETEGGRLAVKDSETGATWDWQTGNCLEGACQGKTLEPLPGKLVYWGVWAQFHPETEIVR